MSKNKKCRFTASLSEDTFSIVRDDFEIETGGLEVTGTGEIRVVNTGGSSASEGGMGSDSDDDKSKGEVTLPGGEKTGTVAGDEDDQDTSFDPIKKNVREAEKKADRD